MNWENSKRKNLGWITTFGAFLFGVTVPMLFAMKLREAQIAAVEANKITELKRLESQQQAEVLQVNLAKSHFHSGLFFFNNGFAEKGIRELVAARSALPRNHQLYDSYERTLLDRILRGGSAVPTMLGTASPDGTLIFAQSHNGKQNGGQIYDVLTGQVVGQPIDLASESGDFAFDSQNQNLYGFLADKTCKIWNVNTGKLVHQSPSFPDRLTNIAFFLDKSLVAFSQRIGPSTNKGIVMRNLRKDQDIFQIPSLSAQLRFRPDGRVFATFNYSPTVNLWSVDSGQRVGKSIVHTGQVNRIDFSKDNTMLVTVHHKVARISSATTGESIVEAISHDYPLVDAKFHPDSTSLMTVAGGCARLWETDTGKLIGNPLFVKDQVRDFGFSPCGKFAWFQRVDLPICVWNVDHQVEVTHMFYSNAIRNIPSFVRDSSRIIYGGNVQETFPYPPLTSPPATAASTQIRDIKFSPNGELIYAADNKRIKAWDTKTQKNQPDFFACDRVVDRFCFSPDGTRFATSMLPADGESTETPYRVQLWDTDTQAPLGSPMDHVAYVAAISFSPNGKLLASGSFSGELTLCDGFTGRMIRSTRDRQEEGEPEPRAIHALVFTNDSKELIVGRSNRIDIVGSADLRNMRRLDSGQSRHYGGKGLALSPDGSRLVSIDASSTCLWDLATGTLLGEPYIDNQSSRNSVTFSKDGTRFFACVGEGYTRTWDGWTCAILSQPMKLHASSFVVLAPNGRQLLTGDSHSWLLWDIEPLPRPKNFDAFVDTMINRVDPFSARKLMLRDEADWYLRIMARQEMRCRLFANQSSEK